MSSASANCFMTTHHSRRRRFCVPERESFALSRQIADFPALTKLRINLRYGHYESITIRRRTSVRRRDGIFMNASELIFSRRGFGKLFAAFLRNKAENFVWRRSAVADTAPHPTAIGNFPTSLSHMTEITPKSANVRMLRYLTGFIFTMTEKKIYRNASTNPIGVIGISAIITPKAVDMHFPP